jgi:predicted DNA-binding protein
MKSRQSDKIGTSFRLTREARQLLTLLARKLGLPRSGLIEIAIRERAKSEGIEVDASAPSGL